MDRINNELRTCSVLTGDFNTRCSKWCNNDITNANGRALDTLTSSAGYKQIINKPIHNVNNSLSCIDLIFFDNLNIVSNYGVDIPILEICHHNIIFGKINIRIPLPPSYVCQVWDYRKANVKNIQKAIQTFDWVKAFVNLSVDGKVDVLNETLMNIFRNYTPNKKVKCNYCQPPWMNEKINVPINVPMCFNLVCHIQNGMIIFLFGMSTCQKVCQFFKYSSYEMLREISIFYSYIKNSMLHLISWLYIS